VTPDHQAVDPPGWLVRVQRDAAGALEQHREHDPCLKAGEGSTDAVVDVTPERHVAARPIEEDLIRMFERCGISVGGAPQQQDRCASRNVHITKRCVLWDRTRVVAEWGLQAERFFHEVRDAFGLLAEMLLKVTMLRKRRTADSPRTTSGCLARCRGGF
jgi:hypothetical protein